MLIFVILLVKVGITIINIGFREMEKNNKIKYPGKRVTTNGNQLVAQTEALISEAGVFYHITPST